MTDAATIREHLIGNLEPIFGKPKNADGLAATLAKHAPDHTGQSALEALAERIIATRKAKGFPSASELIELVGAIPAPSTAAKRGTYISDAEREKQISEAEERARRLLHGSPIARRAVEERWAPGLLEFVRDNGREPGADEEEPIVALSHRNDAIARENDWVMGGAMLAIRELMHWRAARDLGFDLPLPAEASVRARGMLTRRGPAYRNEAPQPVDFTPPDPSTLAPSPELLRTLGAVPEAAE